MAKHAILLGSFLATALVGTANAQAGSFPCDAFQMQQNGMLAVVKQFTISGPNGQVSMGPGASFGPGATMMGVNVYELYQQDCR